MDASSPRCRHFLKRQERWSSFSSRMASTPSSSIADNASFQRMLDLLRELPEIRHSHANAGSYRNFRRRDKLWLGPERQQEKTTREVPHKPCQARHSSKTRGVVPEPSVGVLPLSDRCCQSSSLLVFPFRAAALNQATLCAYAEILVRFVLKGNQKIVGTYAFHVLAAVEIPAMALRVSTMQRAHAPNSL